MSFKDYYSAWRHVFFCVGPLDGFTEVLLCSFNRITNWAFQLNAEDDEAFTKSMAAKLTSILFTREQVARAEQFTHAYCTVWLPPKSAEKVIEARIRHIRWLGSNS